MRKIFSEFGLTVITALSSMYILSIINFIFLSKNGQTLEILKDWIAHLT